MREGYGHKGKHGHREDRELGDHRQLDKQGMMDIRDQHHKSAQTFRRGRATAFLDKLIVNRSTLQRQLDEPELESIKQVICGELKATEAIIEEFIHMFQLHEISSEDKSTEDIQPAGNDLKN